MLYAVFAFLAQTCLRDSSNSDDGSRPCQARPYTHVSELLSEVIVEFVGSI